MLDRVFDTMALDPAAVWWSRTPCADDSLVLLLHGLGSNEHDLASLAAHLPEQHVYASLRGPVRYGDGWAWLEREIRPDHHQLLDSSAAAIEDWLATQPAQLHAAIGFSQGAIMALQLLRRRPDQLAWVAQLSGGPFPIPVPGDHQLARNKPPVFWGHGGQDPTLPAATETQVRDWLAHHTTVTEACDPHLGHDVSPMVISALTEFVHDRAH